MKIIWRHYIKKSFIIHLFSPLLCSFSHYPFKVGIESKQHIDKRSKWTFQMSSMHLDPFTLPLFIFRHQSVSSAVNGGWSLSLPYLHRWEINRGGAEYQMLPRKVTLGLLSWYLFPSLSKIYTTVIIPYLLSGCEICTLLWLCSAHPVSQLRQTGYLVSIKAQASWVALLMFRTLVF